MLCHAMLCYAMPCHAMLTRSSYLLTGFLSFSKLFALPVPLLRQVQKVVFSLQRGIDFQESGSTRPAPLLGPLLGGTLRGFWCPFEDCGVPLGGESGALARTRAPFPGNSMFMFLWVSDRVLGASWVPFGEVFGSLWVPFEVFGVPLGSLFSLWSSSGTPFRSLEFLWGSFWRLWVGLGIF